MLLFDTNEIFVYISRQCRPEKELFELVVQQYPVDPLQNVGVGAWQQEAHDYIRIRLPMSRATKVIDIQNKWTMSSVATQ